MCWYRIQYVQGMFQLERWDEEGTYWYPLCHADHSETLRKAICPYAFRIKHSQVYYAYAS